MRMESLLGGLIPTLAMVAGAAVVIAFAFLAKARLGRIRRKSPFTGQFLREPGHTLARQLEDQFGDLMGYFMMGMMLPIMCIAVMFSTAAFTNKPISHWSWWSFGALGLVGLLWLGTRAYRQVETLGRLRLGYEGEVGVGQELNQLMQQGFRVYHDFPADGFNIDHIVIGRSGVFAVETKGRAKPDTGDGRKDARLEYDGQVLRFPGWTEQAPIEQATRQAVWLSKWLSRAVGERVPVVAVVAVPGWFINQTKPAQILVYNGKRPDKVFPSYAGKPLDPAMIQRIAHQVEAKCRDVAPRAYDRKKPQDHA